LYLNCVYYWNAAGYETNYSNESAYTTLEDLSVTGRNIATGQIPLDQNQLGKNTKKKRRVSYYIFFYFVVLEGAQWNLHFDLILKFPSFAGQIYPVHSNQYNVPSFQTSNYE